MVEISPPNVDNFNKILHTEKQTNKFTKTQLTKRSQNQQLTKKSNFFHSKVQIFPLNSFIKKNPIHQKKTPEIKPKIKSRPTIQLNLTNQNRKTISWFLRYSKINKLL